MTVYVLDHETAIQFENRGFEVSFFTDINGKPIWQFEYHGANNAIEEFAKNSNCFISKSDTVYL